MLSHLYKMVARADPIFCVACLGMESGVGVVVMLCYHGYCLNVDMDVASRYIATDTFHTAEQDHGGHIQRMCLSWPNVGGMLTCYRATCRYCCSRQMHIIYTTCKLT